MVLDYLSVVSSAVRHVSLSIYLLIDFVIVDFGFFSLVEARHYSVIIRR